MTITRERILCIGCGALVPGMNGPIHVYLDAWTVCWELYGQILARKYDEYQYPGVHHLTVKAYALQHPTIPSRSARHRRAMRSCAIQSAAVHLIGLYGVLERGLPGRARGVGSAQGAVGLGGVIAASRSDPPWGGGAG